jgi:hypothetical protein
MAASPMPPLSPGALLLPVAGIRADQHAGKEQQQAFHRWRPWSMRWRR